MEHDTGPRGGSLPSRHSPRAPKNLQQLVVSVTFAVFTATVLRPVTTSVRCHPDLEESGPLVLLIHFLVVAQGSQSGW